MPAWPLDLLLSEIWLFLCLKRTLFLWVLSVQRVFTTPQGVKKDLINLEIDFSRRKSPKRKLKRIVQSQMISMCNKLYGFHPEQWALMLRAAAANVGKAEEDDTEKLVLGLATS